jgi:hypothetical protein
MSNHIGILGREVPVQPASGRLSDLQCAWLAIRGLLGTAP